MDEEREMDAFEKLQSEALDKAEKLATSDEDLMAGLSNMQDLLEDRILDVEDKLSKNDYE